MTLGDKIMNLRKQRGWSQEELAEQLMISRQSVSKWESGASVPELDKIVKISEMFQVSTDYLLKEEVREQEVDIGSQLECQKEAKKVKRVSVQEAAEFMDTTKRLASKMAFAVVLCILSPVCLLLFWEFSAYGNPFFGFRMDENMAGGLGIIILLLFVAGGVVIFIFHGMELSRFEYLEKEGFILQQGVEELVLKNKKGFEKKFRYSISIGVVLCIMGIVPLMVAASLDMGEEQYVYCFILLLMIVAAGVFLFVHAGSIYGSYEKLLQTGDYTPEKKETERRLSFFPERIGA